MSMERILKTERVLATMHVLEKYSDEDHGLMINEIIDYLTDIFPHIDFYRDAIRNDLRDIKKSRFFDLIESGKVGMPSKYSYVGRPFEIHELRILVDAVVSARFITKNEKNRIVNKLKNLTSVHLAESLQNQLYINQSASTDNTQMHLFIDKIHRALQENKQLQFKYGRYNVKKEFVLSRQGELRTFNPYVLYWNNDYYYLIGVEDEKPEKFFHLRVDRMRDVELVNKSFKKEDFDVPTYLDRLFHMYTGKEVFLKVEFHEHLINVIIDRFGKDVEIEETGNNTFILRTKAIMGEGLVRWMLTWGSDAKVYDPPELIEALQKESEKMYEIYLERPL